MLDAPASASRSADVAERRTANSQTWPAQGGGWVTKIAPGDPIFWRNGQRWEPYDVTLRRTADDLMARVGSATVTLPSAHQKALIVESGAHKMSLALEDASHHPAPVAAGTQATYRNVMPGVTRHLRTTTTGVKEDLELASPTARREFLYTLRLGAGLRPDLNSRGDVVVHSGANRIFTIPRGVAYEQNNPVAAHPNRPYRLERDGNSTWRLVVALDEKWANDPARKWPVVLDPEIDVEQGVPVTANECQINYASTLNRTGENTICNGAPVLWAGQYTEYPGAPPGSRVNEAALRFSVLAGGSNAIVTKATLQVVPTATVGTGPFLLRASRLSSRAATTSSTLQHPHAVIADDVKQVTANTPVTMDVTNMVSGWREGRYQNFGVALTTAPGQLDGGSTFTNSYHVSIASTWDPDPAKRPVLTVYTSQRAQAVSEISSPPEGHLTSRYVELVAKAASTNVTSTTFEYLTDAAGEWRTVPASAMRFKADGAALASSTVPIEAGHQRNKVLLWDLEKTPGTEVDGQVMVRAVLDDEGTAGGGYSTARAFRVDRKNAATSSIQDIGPGSVDLLTGNLSVTDRDAEIAAFLKDLTLSRTYTSRSTSHRMGDMFGPGWTSGFDTDGGEMRYRRVYNYTEIDEQMVLGGYMVNPTEAFWDSAVVTESVTPDGQPLIDADFNWNLLAVTPYLKPEKYERKYAVVELADGKKISFEKIGSDYFPTSESADVSLREAGNKLLVEDAKGRTTFEKPTAASVDYHPSSFAQRGSSSGVTFMYETFQNRMRLKRIVAPVVGAVNCDGSAWSARCRMLDLTWNSSITMPRVTEIALLAINAGGSPLNHRRALRTYSYDSTGRLIQTRDPRSPTGLPTSYSYNSDGRLTTYTPPGERPWNFTYHDGGGENAGKLRSVSRKAPNGIDATTTVVYDVPVSGAGAPYDLSRNAISSWGQDDAPLTATAVFPPDSVPSGTGTPSSWARASVHYIGGHGKVTNLADGAGNIETKEYDDLGRVRRELTPRNRERALTASGSTAALARLLDTQHDYHGKGSDLAHTIGPEKEFRRPDGSTVLARKRTVISYNDGRPSEFNGNPPLVTVASIGIRRSSDGVILDEKSTTYGYGETAASLGWRYGKPLSVTVGTGTEAVTTKYMYHDEYPLLLRRIGANSVGTDSMSFQYHALSGGARCDSQAAAGALCYIGPTLAGPHEKRKSQWFQYDAYWNEASVFETLFIWIGILPVGEGQLRTTQRSYDALGREVRKEVSRINSSSGNAIPPVLTTYSGTTGRVTSTSNGNGTILRDYDDNGRLVSYTDALGTTTAYTYDINGRQETATETNGSTSYGSRANIYDDRDQVTSVVDSNLPGPIEAVRDADGQLTSQTLPGGIRMRQTHDRSGAVTSRVWERTTGCAGSACTVSESSVTRDSQDRIAHIQSDRSSTAVSYDSVGRVAGEDASRDGVCVRTQFGYDRHFNRTSRSTNTSAAGNACGSGATSSTTSTYDTHDRITTAGTVYDFLGRTTQVPAGDSPQGAGSTTLTYDVDDLVASISSSTVNQTIQRDPMRRMLWVSTTGSSSSFGAMRYSSDEDRASGKSGATWWERYVEDADGGQLAVTTDLGTVVWQLSDVRGNIVASLPAGATSPSGRAEYGSFFGRGWTTGSWTPTGHAGVVHAALGQYGTQTAGTPGGFIHMGARVYNPVTGRFLQVDPVLDGSANDYDYCNQDPYNCLDLDGKRAFDVVVKFGQTGVQLGRGASLWIANAYIGEASGTVAGALCWIVKKSIVGALFCGGLANGVANSITAVIVRQIFRGNSCLEVGMIIRLVSRFPPVFGPVPYAKAIHCRRV